MQDENAAALTLCPSFNSYSSVTLAETAAKVGEEFTGDLELVREALDEDEFEFSIVRCGPAADADADGYTVSADAVFFDGQIRPIFPVFNRDLLLDERPKVDSETVDVSSIGIPLKKLFFEDQDAQDPPSSSSSSEADELEGIQPGTYCVWTPKAVEPSPGRCKKSKSTGSSSKRWKFRDFLRRSNSDGKDSFVFLTPITNSTKKKEEKSEKTEKTENSKERRLPGEVSASTKAKAQRPNSEKMPSAHEIFYVKNRALKEGEKRRSYLPYRQDLVGFLHRS